MAKLPSMYGSNKPFNDGSFSILFVSSNLLKGFCRTPLRFSFAVSFANRVSAPGLNLYVSNADRLNIVDNAEA